MIVSVASPRISVSQITTLGSSFADDVRSYTAAGLDGLGVWELKLDQPDGSDGAAEVLELFEASGLESAAAVPTVPSILPLPLLGGPEDPAERIDA
jgi:sugar phosphate isomerase/epimerase